MQAGSIFKYFLNKFKTLYELNLFTVLYFLYIFLIIFPHSFNKMLAGKCVLLY